MTGLAWVAYGAIFFVVLLLFGAARSIIRRTEEIVELMRQEAYAKSQEMIQIKDLLDTMTLKLDDVGEILRETRRSVDVNASDLTRARESADGLIASIVQSIEDQVRVVEDIRRIMEVIVQERGGDIDI